MNPDSYDALLDALREEMRGRGDAPRPASETAVRGAEAAMNLTIPPVLRRVYLEVADGGFGPGYGALSMPGGDGYGDWSDVVEAWQDLHSVSGILFPKWLMPVTDWGCAIRSLVDCRDDAGYVWGFDPNGGKQEALFWTEQPIADWLDAGLRDDVRQPDSAKRPAKTRRVWNILGEQSLLPG
jgi:hypothetical protein